MMVSFSIPLFAIALIVLVVLFLTTKKNSSHKKTFAILFALIHWFCSHMKSTLNLYANILVRTSSPNEYLSSQLTEIAQARIVFQWISTVSYILMWVFIILIICQYKKNKSLS